ncbi:MAG TPA: DNA polymerase IV [Patescibacteria group bacterium]
MDFEKITTNGFGAKLILHVDFNSYFATIEQQANPSLRGKPVGIVKAEGRGCIIAASVEAKKFGIKTGSTVWEARKLYPNIVLVPANFDRYADTTKRFIKICSKFTPYLEVFSLDEVFMDVTETEKFFGHVFNIAIEIKKQIKKEIGEWVTCSVGISHNRLLAKLASSQIKPDGIFLICDENKLEILDKSDLTDVCGLGYGLNRHLRNLGINNFAKLRNCSIEFLKRHFGPFWSLHLYNISRGIDTSLLTAYRQIPDAKSVSRTFTTYRDLTTYDEILRLIRNLGEEAAFKARKMGLAGRYVGLSIRGGKYNSAWGHKTLKRYIDRGDDLFQVEKQIFEEFNWNFPASPDKLTSRGGPVRFAGITLGMLTKKELVTYSLFEKDQKMEKVTSAVDLINQKYGYYTILPASLLGIEIIRPEVNGYFGDKSYQLKFNDLDTFK